jgi:hypothetical protein
MLPLGVDVAMTKMTSLEVGRKKVVEPREKKKKCYSRLEEE